MTEATTQASLLPIMQTEASNVAVAQRDVSKVTSTSKHHAYFLSVEPVEAGEKRRKKRNRWGDAAENKAAGLMGLPTMIKANMTNEQLEAYTLHLRIQEISEKLRINDVVPADGDRYVFDRLLPQSSLTD